VHATENTIIREWLNGALFPLSINLTVIIAVYLWQSFQYGRTHGFRWTQLSGVKTACALFWVFFAESVRAGFVWLSLRMTNRSGFTLTQPLIDIANGFLVVSALVLTAALLRCTYIFTPPNARRVYWAYSLACAAVFLLLAYAFPNFPATVQSTLGD
jgi:hypothetical protein